MEVVVPRNLAAGAPTAGALFRIGSNLRADSTPVSLRGAVQVHGAKNTTLPIMAASILVDEPVVLERVPRLSDVDTLAEVLRDLGMGVEWTGANDLSIETLNARRTTAGYRHVQRMRASFCVLGPLLARRGRARVSLPGGCAIGDRPVDLHLRGLAALGADLRIESGDVIATARKLRGAKIHLSGPQGSTVTGTANVLSAAVLAEGHTTITGAAREPEIVDLGHFLNACGARIAGLGSSTLEIDGVSALGGRRHRVIGDRIEAATLLIAAAMTGGQITVAGINPDWLTAVLETLTVAGASIASSAENHLAAITLTMNQRPNAFNITATPYPGVPTDLQPQLTALAAIADGDSIIHDCVFPHRWAHVAELRRLGAIIEPHAAGIRVRGVDQLSGAPLAASDLRGGAALVLAALAARGETTLHGVEHIDRGYSRLEQTLTQLGAMIQRVDPITAPVLHSGSHFATLKSGFRQPA